MASRVQDIRTAVEAFVAAAFPTVTISNVPLSFDTVPKSQFPFANVVFDEAEPERLRFKQERRRVIGGIAVGVQVAAGSTTAATREIVHIGIQAIRDAIFADEDLSGDVDDISCEAGVAVSGEEDPIVYGTLEVLTEEVF